LPQGGVAQAGQQEASALGVRSGEQVALAVELDQLRPEAGFDDLDDPLAR
jgi:hypothetical protein